MKSHKYVTTAVDAILKTGPGVLHSVTITAAGDAASVILYDNTAASGSIICKLGAATTESANAVLDVAFGKGIYADVSGTTPSVTVTLG